MNTNTGEVGRFTNDAERRKAGFDMNLTEEQAKWIKTMTTEERLKRLPEIKLKLIQEKIETIKKNIPKKSVSGQTAVVLQQLEDIVKA